MQGGCARGEGDDDEVDRDGPELDVRGVEPKLVGAVKEVGFGVVLEAQLVEVLVALVLEQVALELCTVASVRVSVSSGH